MFALYFIVLFCVYICFDDTFQQYFLYICAGLMFITLLYRNLFGDNQLMSLLQAAADGLQTEQYKVKI